LAIKEDPYYNALQIKFAYAVTCHKAQGGQWDAVFVDQGYLTEEMIDLDFLRWLYTAITRAKRQLFLVNFAQTLFLSAAPEEEY
jgi:exodeoxyribonuclease-5